jgi:hypothetical protein
MPFLSLFGCLMHARDSLVPLHAIVHDFHHDRSRGFTIARPGRGLVLPAPRSALGGMEASTALNREDERLEAGLWRGMPPKLSFQNNARILPLGN